MPTTEKCSLPVPGGRAFWWTRTLWAASAGLPVRPVPIVEIREFDEDCWFGGQAPSCREVAEHARRIEEADLAHPVILTSDGQLMDGGHRIAKAWLEGREAVDAVRFAVDPEPDWMETDASSLASAPLIRPTSRERRRGRADCQPGRTDP